MKSHNHTPANLGWAGQEKNSQEVMLPVSSLS